MKTIVHTTISPCDNERRIFHEAETGVAAGYRVVILALKTPDVPKEETRRGFCIQRLWIPFWRGGPLKFLLFNLRLFIRLLFTKFDLLHCHDLWVLPASALAARLRSRKLVYDAHEYYAGLEIFLHKRLSRTVWLWTQKLLISRVDALIAINTHQLKLYQQDFPQLKQGWVLHNFPRKSQSTEADPPPFEQRQNCAVFQGIFKPGRGLLSLLAAAEHLEDEEEIWLIGFGELEPIIQKQLSDHSRRSHIRLLGKLPLEDIPHYTRSARAGLVLFEPTSINYRYASPNKFFEYVHAGTPLVASRIPPFEAFNQQFEVALLVDPNNPMEISRAIRTLLRDAQVWTRLHQQCMQARNVWNWEQQEKQLQIIYQQLSL
ncbi:MAG: glycosyltransferase family 4 protein [Calditrichaeota bacterium]|nr:glycosyltransferase family 4 protein [Calditrichota bacterium]